MSLTQDRSLVPDPVADARSVLSCPTRVRLLAQWLPLDVGEIDLDGSDGRALLICRTDSALAELAGGPALALLTVHSGADVPHDRGDSLALSGRLESRGVLDCDCCGERRQVVELVPTFALLTRPAADGRPEQHHRIPLAQLTDPRHHLNAGYLRRTRDHVNEDHGAQLRASVASVSGRPVRSVVSAWLAELTAEHALVDWVGTDGGHRTRIEFDQRARTPDELGTALRAHLHGTC